MKLHQAALLAAGFLGLLGGTRFSAAAAAPFRLLYSNDTTNIGGVPKSKLSGQGPLVQQRLEASADEAADADVQLLQPGNGWVPWWKSTIYPPSDHYRWYRDEVRLPIDDIGNFMMNGGDMVAPFLTRAKKLGNVPFISIRLNDYHGNETLDYLNKLAAGEGRGRDYSMFIRTQTAWESRYQLQHPEYRLRPDPAEYTAMGPDDQLKYIGQMRRRINLRTARVWNWAIPEVPAYKLSLIKELIANYDLPGLELDFMRWSSFFRVEETTAEQRVGIMVAFIKEVRAALDQRGGPHRWLCVRVPLRLSGHSPLGVDLPRWVAAGVDLVNLSCHYTTDSQTDLPEICRMIPHTPVYLEMTFVSARYAKLGIAGTLIGNENTDIYRKMTDEQFYTLAHVAYARGGSGVSLFNFVYYRGLTAHKTEPPFHIFPRLKDPAWLAQQPQHYFLSNASNPPSAPSQFALNRIVEAGKASTFLIDTAPPTGGWKNDGRLRFQSQHEMDRDFRARVNGKVVAATADVSEPYPAPYEDGIGDAKTQRAFIVPKELLKDGMNSIEIEFEHGEPVELVYLDLAIR
jgi:hypothetical protein